MDSAVDDALEQLVSDGILKLVRTYFILYRQNLYHFLTLTLVPLFQKGVDFGVS